MIGIRAASSVGKAIVSLRIFAKSVGPYRLIVQHRAAVAHKASADARPLPGQGEDMKLDYMTNPVTADPVGAIQVSPEERLETQLQCRLGNRIRDLRVHLHAAGLVLQGRTATYHAKQLAQHAAMELANVPILANDIEVR
jgi:hypothetical protein